MRTASLLHHSVENLSVMFFFPFLLLVVSVFFEYSGLDIWWVSHFYDAQHQVWPYRGHWLFYTIIHSGGQLFDWSVAAIWLLLFLFVNLKKQFRPYRKILLFFFCRHGSRTDSGRHRKTIHSYLQSLGSAPF
ncbi:hypothetical protein VU00_10096 [Candidatus Electrothrix marina]|uniref:PAP2 superfamily protein n=1 Tax=Candidatus Electrothrix marina TaxID=1859130 RepID=A0A3S3QL70_9BACT|nr:hypothetical protein VU00_10096 [Candidatus Electrothrix marina]